MLELFGFIAVVIVVIRVVKEIIGDKPIEPRFVIPNRTFYYAKFSDN
jgi:hypothetical protein